MPYVIMAYRINAYGEANAPDGFQMPNVRDLWRVVASVFITLTASWASEFLMLPLVLKLDLKGGDDAELRREHALKSVRCFYNAAYYTFVTLWGYSILKDTNWLPGWMGGLQNGNLENMLANMPFTPYPPSLVNYFLFTTGNSVTHLILHI